MSAGQTISTPVKNGTKPAAPPPAKPAVAKPAAPPPVAAKPAGTPAEAATAGTPAAEGEKKEYYNSQRTKLGFCGFNALKVRRAIRRMQPYAADTKRVAHAEAQTAAEELSQALGLLESAAKHLESVPKEASPQGRRAKGEGGASPRTSTLDNGTIVCIRAGARKGYADIMEEAQMDNMEVSGTRGLWVSVKLSNGEGRMFKRTDLALMARSKAHTPAAQ